MKKNLIIFLVIAPLFGAFLAGARVFYAIKIWDYEGKPQIFQVKKGEPFSSINYRLGKEKFISNTRIFHRYAQILGVMTDFQAGKYRIQPGSNMTDIIETLVSGQPLTIDVTIPEGKNLFQIAKILAKHDIAKEKRFISLATDEKFTRELGIPAKRVEGYLFPETYHFNERLETKEIIRIMVNEFKEQTNDLKFDKSSMSRHEIVTLASIVEKETGAAWERPRIAGVFFNRLDKGMRLQSDPTTIYGIFEEFNGNLQRRDLQRKTPYNTYRIGGLPEGPIANPGLESLKASIRPEEHDYLFFVSKNDGTHVFTKSYKEHRQAVRYWQKNPENREGRSWRDLKDSAQKE